MYRAKERGRARYELFDEVHARPAPIARLRVENDLRRALERDELTPRLPAASSRCATARSSASRRWSAGSTPSAAAIAPADFIPVAEETGLIEPIGRWVLEHACRQAARWYRDAARRAPIGIAVNLSARAARQPRACRHGRRAPCAPPGLDPACLSPGDHRDA